LEASVLVKVYAGHFLIEQIIRNKKHMNNLARQTIIGFIQLIIGLGAMLFAPAWTFMYWQAWIYLFIFGISVVLIFIYLYKNDSKLLERRLNRTEKEKSQKWIHFFIYILYISLLILSSLDHRFLLSNVPFSVVMAGDVLVALGYRIIFIVFKDNTFAAATIELTSDHKVISKGLYAIVRHPMYLGAIVLLLGTPLALGSWWGLLIFILITYAIVLRLLDEEKFLFLNLTGYKEYCQKTRYRLIPFVW
jgi:protein-S-isoprenylcysteine O-methyltransferase Ste14